MKPTNHLLLCCMLVHGAYSEIIEGIGLSVPFDEMNRKIMLAARLRDRALGPLRRLRGRKHATLGELMMHFLTGPLSACITEARASFAMVDRQPTVTWLTEHFKSAILQMKTEWRELIVPAMDAQVLDDYAAEALHRHPEYWRVLGFASQDAYRETVCLQRKACWQVPVRCMSSS